MSENRLILVTGGARSGKSIYAEKLAREQGEKVVYLATAAALDSEMKERIKAHQAARPSSWLTLEETLKVVETLRKIPPDTEVVLLDCLTLWISNLMLEKAGPREPSGEEVKFLEEELIQEGKRLVEELGERNQTVIVVSNELGLGVVPEFVLGRIFRDVVGKANQMLAQAADEVYFLISSIPMKIKG